MGGLDINSKVEIINETPFPKQIAIQLYRTDSDISLDRAEKFASKYTIIDNRGGEGFETQVIREDDELNLRYGKQGFRKFNMITQGGYFQPIRLDMAPNIANVKISKDKDGNCNIYAYGGG